MIENIEHLHRYPETKKINTSKRPFIDVAHHYVGAAKLLINNSEFQSHGSSALLRYHNELLSSFSARIKIKTDVKSQHDLLMVFIANVLKSICDYFKNKLYKKTYSSLVLAKELYLQSQERPIVTTHTELYGINIAMTDRPVSYLTSAQQDELRSCLEGDGPGWFQGLPMFAKNFLRKIIKNNYGIPGSVLKLFDLSNRRIDETIFSYIGDDCPNDLSYMLGASSSHLNDRLDDEKERTRLSLMNLEQHLYYEVKFAVERFFRRFGILPKQLPVSLITLLSPLKGSTNNGKSDWNEQSFITFKRIAIDAFNEKYKYNKFKIKVKINDEIIDYEIELQLFDTNYMVNGFGESILGKQKQEHKRLKENFPKLKVAIINCIKQMCDNENKLLIELFRDVQSDELTDGIYKRVNKHFIDEAFPNLKNDHYMSQSRLCVLLEAIYKYSCILKSDEINIENRASLAALEAIMQMMVGGVVHITCKSGKDRTGYIKLVITAYMLHYIVYGCLPTSSDTGNAKDRYLECLEVVYLSSHEQLLAGLNGAIGLKSQIKEKGLKGMLPIDLQKRINTINSDFLEWQNICAKLNKISFKKIEKYIKRSKTAIKEDKKYLIDDFYRNSDDEMSLTDLLALCIKRQFVDEVICLMDLADQFYCNESLFGPGVSIDFSYIDDSSNNLLYMLYVAEFDRDIIDRFILLVKKICVLQNNSDLIHYFIADGLRFSCETANVALIKHILSYNIDINVPVGPLKRNAIHSLLASRCPTGDVIKCLEILLEQKPDLNEFDWNKMTSMHYAVQFKNIIIIDELIKCGANLNIQYGALQEDDYNEYASNWSPLHIAASTCTKPTDPFLQTLIKKGAIKDLEDSNKLTYLDYISQKKGGLSNSLSDSLGSRTVKISMDYLSGCTVKSISDAYNNVNQWLKNKKLHLFYSEMELLIKNDDQLKLIVSVLLKKIVEIVSGLAVDMHVINYLKVMILEISLLFSKNEKSDLLDILYNGIKDLLEKYDADNSSNMLFKSNSDKNYFINELNPNPESYYVHAIKCFSSNQDSPSSYGSYIYQFFIKNKLPCIPSDNKLQEDNFLERNFINNLYYSNGAQLFMSMIYVAFHCKENRGFKAVLIDIINSSIKSESFVLAFAALLVLSNEQYNSIGKFVTNEKFKDSIKNLLSKYDRYHPFRAKLGENIIIEYLSKAKKVLLSEGSYCATFSLTAFENKLKNTHVRQQFNKTKNIFVQSGWHLPKPMDCNSNENLSEPTQNRPPR